MTVIANEILQAYKYGLNAARGDSVVQAAMANRTFAPRCLCIAIGKAAPAMAAGALNVLGARIYRGLVVTKAGYGGQPWPTGWLALEAGHPIPDQMSLDAGRAGLAALREVPDDVEVLLLVSGGASSLVEVLAPGWDLVRLQRLNRWLLGSGWSIDQINAVRQNVSMIKGGKLRRYLSGRTAHVFALSDVRGDDASVIGSGLLSAPRRIALPSPLPAEYAINDNGPGGLDTSAYSGCEIALDVVANNCRARSAVGEYLSEAGFAVTVHDDEQYGDAVATGYDLAEFLLRSKPGIHVWGGETTVQLPQHPGRGGRCQALALAAAKVFDGVSKVGLLAAGTDGSDGPGKDAGAMVNGETLARARRAGKDAEDHLTRADAGTLLSDTASLITTGPTGTNVMDLMLGWRE